MIMSRLKLPCQAFRSVYLCRYKFEVLHVFSQEVADVEDGVVIIDCVAIFMKRTKEANIIATRISLDVGFRGLKNASQS